MANFQVHLPSIFWGVQLFRFSLRVLHPKLLKSNQTQDPGYHETIVYKPTYGFWMVDFYDKLYTNPHI